MPDAHSTTTDETRSSQFSRKVGFRFLGAKKSSRFLSLITGISIGGVAVGVMTLIVTLSVMGGFESELKSKLLQAETHILVQSEDPFFNYDPAFIERLRATDPLIQKVYPVLQTEVILRLGKKVSGGLIKGVATDQMDAIKSTVVEWAPQELLADAKRQGTLSSLFLGQELAYDAGVIPGDIVTAVSPVEADGPFGSVPRMKKFVVEGIYRTGVPEQEMHAIFAKIEDVESFLRRAGIVSQIEIRTSDLEKTQGLSRKIEAAIQSAYPESKTKYLVRAWQQLNAHLFESLRLERLAMFCILIFIVVVASFNIVSMLTMMVIEKRKSLSVLRAMGATSKQIARIFLWEGFAIGVLGVGVGCFGGLGICLFLDRYPLIELPEYFYDRSLPVQFDWVAIALIMAVTLGICVAGAVMPARKASELTPLEGIRGG